MAGRFLVRELNVTIVEEVCRKQLITRIEKEHKQELLPMAS